MLKCLWGKPQVSRSAHGTHSAYSRTPAGATGHVLVMLKLSEGWESTERFGPYYHM